MIGVLTERRRDWRLIKLLVIAQAVTFVIAMTAGYLSLTEMQIARIDSARDSCELIKGIALKAATGRTRPRTLAYIAQTPLADCSFYATHLPTK